MVKDPYVTLTALLTSQTAAFQWACRAMWSVRDLIRNGENKEDRKMFEYCLAKYAKTRECYMPVPTDMRTFLFHSVNECMKTNSYISWNKVAQFLPLKRKDAVPNRERIRKSK